MTHESPLQKPAAFNSLGEIQEEVVRCARCPRLVRWRERAAREKVARFADEKYWGKPVPSFGDIKARVMIVGLAPAAHGGNRTGRMFTGDRSGDWLYRALHRFGFANQALSASRTDGLNLIDCYVTASARCAPPLNKLLPGELNNCRPFLAREFRALGFTLNSRGSRAVVALGKVAFESVLKTFAEIGGSIPTPRPRFSHGAEHRISPSITLIASFHPSQQNTFTGRLTEAMLDRIFRRARQIVAR
jgi:uracil-DNA glycosylase family 4